MKRVGGHKSWRGTEACDADLRLIGADDIAAWDEDMCRLLSAPSLQWCAWLSMLFCVLDADSQGLHGFAGVRILNVPP